MQYDIELFLSDLELFLRNNLNGFITGINTEKNDTITLLTIPDEAYFFQTMNEQVANYDPFLFYGIQSITNAPIGPATVEKYIIAVVIVMVDQGTDLFIGKRLLRYNRALRDLFHSKFGQIGDNLYLKVSSLEPVAFSLANSTDAYRAIGVEVEVNIG